MKKVLVTGATGFIGNYVVEALMKNNVQVIATSATPEKAQRFNWFSDVRYIPLNFEDLDFATDYFRYFDQPDVLIHLAWEGLPNYKAAYHTEVNLHRHAAFLENIIKNGLQHLLVTGTCFEYGMKEGCLREDMPAHPENAYAFAKDELRKFLEQMQQKYSYCLQWVRLFYMYGKGQNPNSLLSQLDKAIASGDRIFNMSGGEQVRDYLPVGAVAAGIVRIGLQQEVAGIINCCSGNPVTIKQLVTSYIQDKNYVITLNLGYYPYTDYEPMAFWGDDTKMKSLK